ncbi:MAG: response regulator [Deferrisomatales bacterium]
MCGDPAGGAQASAQGECLTANGRQVYLLAPAGAGADVAEGLGARGYQVQLFDGFEPFIDRFFVAPPWAVVVWAALPAGALEATLEVLHHHLRARDCAVVLVGDPDAPGSPAADRVHAVVPAPVDVGRLDEIFRECSQAGVQPGGDIPRILVVDDDQNMVLLGSHIVSSMGMIPLVAFDGPQAIEKARRLTPDLILLDINMPIMDGFDVIRALKADTATSLVPIIVFSARKREEDKVRALQLGADDYVTKPFSITELGARIDRLLKRTRTGVSASSTTGLPGSVSVEQILADRTSRRVPLAVLYLDADHFKAFNDRYGFARGDSVIRQAADLVLDSVRALGNPEDFSGHIGGDDFVVITTPDRATAIADDVIARFDRIVPFYYDPVDRARGCIETEDRKGRRTTFPVMSLSIAIVTNESREFTHPAELADVAAQLKKYAKSRPGSLWVKDQRADGAQGDE